MGDVFGSQDSSFRYTRLVPTELSIRAMRSTENRDVPLGMYNAASITQSCIV